MSCRNLISNSIGKTREEVIGGRNYTVAPLTLIVPGVLSGSKGPLYYSPDETAKAAQRWNGMPITVGHPVRNGRPVSARTPGISEEYEIGRVYNVQFKDGKLVGDGYFDTDTTLQKSKAIASSLAAGQPIELSTGLFTDDVVVENGNHNGISYGHEARDHQPDHLAVLVDQRGACSLNDGCGVLINKKECECGGKCEDCRTDNADFDSLPRAAQKAAFEHMDSGAAFKDLLHADGPALGKMAYSDIDSKLAGLSKMSVKALHEVAAAAGRTTGHIKNKGELVATMVRMVKDQKENWDRNQPAQNALGPGNHSLAKRAAHADELSAKAEETNDPADHAAAAVAHHGAAAEASNASSTWAEPDRMAAGKHKNKARYHEDMAQHLQEEDAESPEEEAAEPADNAFSPQARLASALAAKLRWAASRQNWPKKPALSAESEKVTTPAASPPVAAQAKSAESAPSAASVKSAAQNPTAKRMSGTRKGSMTTRLPMRKQQLAKGPQLKTNSFTPQARVDAAITRTAVDGGDYRKMTGNKGTAMTREQGIELLTTNTSEWAGLDEALGEMTDDQLNTILAGVLGKEDEATEVPEEAEEVAAVTNHRNGPKTVDEYLAEAPPQIIELLDTANRITQNAKKEVVQQLVANVADPKRRQIVGNKLMSKPLPELEEMLELRGPTVNQRPRQQVMYFGAQGGPPIVNSDDGSADVEAMTPPTLNFSEAS